MATVDDIIKHISEYLEAIQIIRDRQLNVLSENIRQQNELNEIDVWNNALALSYMKHRYTLLKQALLLLSDSQQHVWLTFGRKSHKNAYEPILRDIISKFNHQDMAGSLEEACSQMASEHFQQELSQLRRKIWIDKALFILSLTITILAILAVTITCLLIGLSTHSVALGMFGFLFPVGIGFLSLISYAVSRFVATPPLSRDLPPIPFKEGIERQFSSLEEEFKKEKENFEFTALASDLSFSSSLSIAKENVSKSTLAVEPPTNFKKQQSRIELYTTFNQSKFLFLSPSDLSGAPSLKESVNEEYARRNAPK